MNKTLQDPDVVGTALKTISMRLMKTSGELEELGEDAQGAASSITQLQTKLLNLTGGKVNIMEDDSNFKSTYQILTELSQVWGQLEEVQRSQITELVAGIRQGNAFNAVLTNMSEASKVVAYSMNSSGSALEENAKYLDSIAGKASIFNAEWEELSSKTLDSGLIKGILDFGTGILSWINDIGGLIPILTTVLGLLISIKGVDFVKSLVNPLILLRKKILAGTKSFADLRHSFKVASKDGLNFASTFDLIYGKGTFAMTALKGAVAAVTTAITIAVVAVQAYNQKMRELRQEAVDSAKSLNDSLASINEYKKQISELGTQLDSGNLSEKEAYDVRSQLLEIQEKIIDTYGREAQAIDLLTDKTGASIRKLDQLGRAQVSAWEAENFKAITNARDLLNENTTTQFSQYTTNNNTELVEILRSLGAYEFVVPGSGAYWSHTSGTVQDEIEWLTELSLKLAEYGDTYEDVREDIASKISKLKSDDFIESLELAQAHFESKLTLDSEYVQFYASITEAQERYNTALIEQDEAAKTDALSDLFDLMQQIKQVADDDVDASFFEDLFDPQISAIHANEFSEAVRSDANHIQQTIQGSLDKIKTAIASSQDVTGDVNLDNLSLAGIIGSREKLDDDRIGTEGVSELIDLCEEYNLTVDELVDSLVDLGYIQGEVLSENQPAVTDQSAAVIQTAIDSYNTVIDEANQLFAEQELNPEKLISSKTFDYLVASGSDLVSVLEIVRDEAGNVTGWRIAEDAMNSYIEEQLEAAKATLGSNDALSAHYAALTLYFGELGTYNERVAKATEENEKLGEAYKKAAKGEQFTYSEMQELIQAFPELSFAIDDVTGQYDLNAQSVLGLINQNFDLIKSLSQLKLAYLELQAVQTFQNTKTTSGGKRTEQAAGQQIAFLKQKIDENNLKSLEEYELLFDVQVKDEAWRAFIQEYTAIKADISKSEIELNTLKVKTPERIKKEAEEEKKSSFDSESLFNQQKSQLDMERDALEAGRTLEDRYRQFRLESEADYWDHYETIVHNAYRRNELDAVEYQNHLTEIEVGRQAMREKALESEIEENYFDSCKRQLDMERDALENKRTLEDEFRKYNLTSEADYWDAYEQEAKSAYKRGELDAIEYQDHLNTIAAGRQALFDQMNAGNTYDALTRQLELEKDAWEAGFKIETQYLRYHIDSLAEYYDTREKLARDAYSNEELTAVEFFEEMLSIHQARADELAKTNSYDVRLSQLDLEREALEAGFRLEDQYRKFGIESDAEYYEAKKQLAAEAYRSGELTGEEYQGVLIEAHTAELDRLAQSYADQLDILDNEKKKLEAGMAWDTAVLVDLDDYFDKFTKINEERFKANLITASEFVDGLIAVFEHERSRLDKTLSDYEHDIYLWQQQNESGDYDPWTESANNAKIISSYETMQRLVHEAAEAYREEMSGTMSAIEIEHSDFIKELQRQWWDYQQEIDRINEQIFSDALDSYKTYISNCNKFSLWRGDTEIDAYGRTLDFLESSYQNDLITYEQYLNEKVDLLDSMYDAEKARQQAYVDEALRIMRKEREALEEELAQYEEKKSNYETAVSTVVDFIDERIKALQDENDELDKQVKLQNALEEIERARSQRTKRVYVEGVGFEWMADDEAIRDAQESYDDLKAESDLEDQVEALEAYKKAWQDTVDSYKRGQNEKITAQIFGNRWQDMLTTEMIAIEQRGADGINYIRDVSQQKLNTYAAQYKSICDQLDDKVDGSVANQIADLDDLIGQWEDAIDDIERELNAEKGLLDWAAEFEGLSYEERGKLLDKFKIQSVANLREIQSAAEEASQALADLEAAKAEAARIESIKQEMYDNSVAWHSAATEEEKKALSDRNLELGGKLGWNRDEASGKWYTETGEQAYTIPIVSPTIDEVAKKNQMIDNSAAWWSASDEEKEALAAENEKLGAELGYKKDEETGIWYDKNGEIAYTVVKIPGYNTGGVVDYTGLARVHGSSTRAETVFNASDSAKLYEYVHSVPSLVQDLIDKLNVAPKVKRDGSSVEIKEIHLHDVQNVDGLADAIVRTLPLKLAQKMGK